MPAQTPESVQTVCQKTIGECFFIVTATHVKTE